MNPFKNLKTDGLEESTDRIGGFAAVASNIYTGTIKAYYAGQSARGAHNITMILGLEGGKEYRETVYITNTAGENFYLNKQDKTKKLQLPGFIIANDIALCTIGHPISELDFEDKVVNVYDADAKKELPKSVKMAVGLLGMEITVAVLKQLEDKTAKVGDEYVPTGDTKETNVIDKVFNTESKMTVAEAIAGEKAPKFHDAWLERNEDKTRDKTAKNDNTKSNGVAGRPGGNAGGPPVAGAAAAGGARKSLFGK